MLRAKYISLWLLESFVITKVFFENDFLDLLCCSLVTLYCISSYDLEKNKPNKK